MPLRLKIVYANGTHLDTDLSFRFVSGRAWCPDGAIHPLKRISPDAGDLTTGQSIRAAVYVNGKTVTGSLILASASMDEPAARPLEFTPDPKGKNAHAFASTTTSEG